MINLVVSLAILNATDLLNIGGHTNICMYIYIYIYTLGILAHLLRMVSWNLNTMRFGGDYTPLSHHRTFGGWIHRDRIPLPLILLMEEILQHLGCTKPCKQADKLINYLYTHIYIYNTTTGAGFLPSTVGFQHWLGFNQPVHG